MKNTWEPGAEARYVEDWFRNLSPDDQEHYKDQDKDRIAAHYAVLDGSMMREAFVTLCCEQFRANLRGKRLFRGDFLPSIAELAGLMNDHDTNEES